MFLSARSWHINLQLLAKYFVQHKLMLWHYCKLCGIPNTNLICATCYSQLELISEPGCNTCLKPLQFKGQPCINCHNKIIYYDKLYAHFSYAKPLNKILHEFKYNGQTHHAWTLGYILFQQVRQDYDAIIPIPLHPNKLKERGFNQADLMLDYFRAKHLPVQNNWVIRVRDTHSQALSKWSEREQNLSAAFTLQYNITGLKILLVDDVVTTGSTINELAKLLKQNGAANVDACALLRTT